MFRSLLFVVLMLAVAPVAQAEALSCRAQVALNRIYDIDLDTTSGEIAIRNDAGTTANGRATVYVSATTGNTILYLPAGFTRGFEIELEQGGAQRIAFCLAANECYLCRR